MFWIVFGCISVFGDMFRNRLFGKFSCVKWVIMMWWYRYFICIDRLCVCVILNSVSGECSGVLEGLWIKFLYFRILLLCMCMMGWNSVDSLCCVMILCSNDNIGLLVLCRVVLEVWVIRLMILVLSGKIGLERGVIWLNLDLRELKNGNVL